jgi:Ham1 family
MVVICWYCLGCFVCLCYAVLCYLVWSCWFTLSSAISCSLSSIGCQLREGIPSVPFPCRTSVFSSSNDAWPSYDSHAIPCHAPAPAHSYPHRKWFLTTLGHTGLNNLLAAYADKSAEAICTFAYSAGPGEEPLLFQGKTLGKIVPARGAGTFGMYGRSMMHKF